jgi:hypothetical protein
MARLGVWKGKSGGECEDQRRGVVCECVIMGDLGRTGGRWGEVSVQAQDEGLGVNVKASTEEAPVGWPSQIRAWARWARARARAMPRSPAEAALPRCPFRSARPLNRM